jgi:UDP-glucuronate 4-epimerase
LRRGESVLGIDNLNEYYDPQLKQARLARLTGTPGFTFAKVDICDHDALRKLAADHGVDAVCHLAAQAGVRYSLDHPFAYQTANGEGFLSVIEVARHRAVRNFVYASSSSVYGGSKRLPFREDDPVDRPVSLYAATKRSNELVASCYNHLYGVPCSGLRFFTVYGPWGRPDMALFIFTRAMLEGRPIDVYNHGRMVRNFTYVDDIVQGVLLAIDTPAPCEVYNIGNDRAEQLMDFIGAIERALGVTAQKRYLPLQAGDVPETVADISKMRGLGFCPSTGVEAGVREFVKWYREYCSI